MLGEENKHVVNGIISAMVRVLSASGGRGTANEIVTGESCDFIYYACDLIVLLLIPAWKSRRSMIRIRDGNLDVSSNSQHPFHLISDCPIECEVDNNGDS